MVDEEELDKIQDRLTEEELETEKDEVVVDNRSIYTLRDAIVKKSDKERADEQEKS